MTWVVLVMVEVRIVEDPAPALEEPVMPPTELPCGAELPPVYDAEPDGLPLAVVELDAASTVPLAEAELETAPVLEPAGTPPVDDGYGEPEAGEDFEPEGVPLPDAEAEVETAPELAGEPPEDEVGADADAEFDGAALEWMVTVEL